MKKLTFQACLYLALASAVGGCGFPYRIDVEQGNVVTQKDLNRLSIGMSKPQVQSILGTSLLQDTFHKDRWDYQQRYKNGKTNQWEKSKVVLYFNNGLLSRIEKDGYASIKTEPVPYSVEGQ